MYILKHDIIFLSKNKHIINSPSDKNVQKVLKYILEKKRVEKVDFAESAKLHFTRFAF